MSLPVLEPASSDLQQDKLNRRYHSPEAALVLRELSPLAVIDHRDGDSSPIVLTTFGSVRETCPKCGHGHLRLVLRQQSVRTAHLFCAGCESCFDAYYANGAPALTI
jgi:hypothetical protein